MYHQRQLRNLVFNNFKAEQFYNFNIKLVVRNKGTLFGLIVKIKIKFLVIRRIECTFEKHLKN